MTERCLVVTGAGGFIGSELIGYFAAAGWKVRALARRPAPSYPPNGSFVRYALEDPVPAEALAGADALVHCAYARGDLALDVAAAERLLAGSRAAGVRRNVLLSSLSARDGAPSVYGRQKAAVERLFSTARDTVLRAGLVVGRGGLFGAMRAHVRDGRPVPVVGGGRQPVQIVAIADLLRAISAVIDRDLAGLFVVAHPEAVPYRELQHAIARHEHVRPWLIPVPYHLGVVALRTAEALRLRLPIRRDSLVGLRAMTWVDPRPSLERLELRLASLSEALLELTP